MLWALVLLQGGLLLYGVRLLMELEKRVQALEADQPLPEKHYAPDIDAGPLRRTSAWRAGDEAT